MGQSLPIARRLDSQLHAVYKALEFGQKDKLYLSLV